MLIFNRTAALLLIAFSLLFLAGCEKGPNYIDNRYLSEININRMIPTEGKDQGYSSELIASITDKATIAQLINSIERAEKGNTELSYAKEHIMHYEIRLVYKSIEKPAISLWLNDHMDKAVISTVGYYYLDKYTTETIRELIK